jgi:hypothetical protein
MGGSAKTSALAVINKVLKGGSDDGAIDAVAGGLAGDTGKPGIIKSLFGFIGKGIKWLFSTNNIPLMLGSVGGAVLIGLIIRNIRKRKQRNRQVEEAWALIGDDETIARLESNLVEGNTENYFDY